MSSAPYSKPPGGHRCGACHQLTYVVEQGEGGRRYAVCLSGHRTRVIDCATGVPAALGAMHGAMSNLPTIGREYGAI